MYDGPSSGGIATHDLTSLDDIVLRVVMVPLREMYRNLTLEQIAHKNTLKLFQAFLDGELPEGKLIVNPDGWQIEVERPVDEPETDVKTDRGFAYDEPGLHPWKEVNANGPGLGDALQALETAS